MWTRFYRNPISIFLFASIRYFLSVLKRLRTRRRNRCTHPSLEKNTSHTFLQSYDSCTLRRIRGSRFSRARIQLVRPTLSVRGSITCCASISSIFGFWTLLSLGLRGGVRAARVLCGIVVVKSGVWRQRYNLYDLSTWTGTRIVRLLTLRDTVRTCQTLVLRLQLFW